MGLLCGAILLPAAACGPWFPSSYLEGGAGTMSPYVDFAFALLDIAAALPPDDAPPTAFPSSPLTALEAGVADLATALATPEAVARWPRDQRARWLQDYRAVATRVHAGEAEPGRLLADWPAELTEFVLYLEGAADLLAHQHEDRQPAAWQRLLDLPPAQRRHRTVWVRYMQGTRHAKFDRPAEAATAYAEVRRLVREGAPDRLGLAYASIRRAYRDAGTLHERLVAAPRALARSAACPDLAAYREILADATHVLDRTTFDDAVLDPLLADPVSAEVLVAYLANRRADHTTEIAQHVLARLPPQPIPGAERAAFVAHQQGNDALARQWLEVAPRDGLIALWLVAGFQREAGDYVAAAATYRSWLQQFEKRRAEFAQDRSPLGSLFPYSEPTRPRAGVSSLPLFMDEQFQVLRRMDEEVYAQLGSTLVYRKDFLQALDCFLRAHSWVDAAYLAESVIPLNDLETYVRGQDREAVRACAADVMGWGISETAWPPDPLDLARRRQDEKPPLDPLVVQQAFLRYLLGRRLVREDQAARAVPYLPPALQPGAVRLARLLRQADDVQRPAEERALACYNAARILRWQGLEISGAELYPDSRFVDGQYEYGVNPEASEQGVLPPVLYEGNLEENVRQRLDAAGTPTAADLKEAAELFRQQPPVLRFHYRLRAAGLMWRCAGLTRDDQLKGLAFYTAGHWLRDRQPALARLCAQRCRLVGAERSAAAAWMQRRGWFTTRLTDWMQQQVTADLPALQRAADIPAQLFKEPQA